MSAGGHARRRAAATSKAEGDRICEEVLRFVRHLDRVLGPYRRLREPEEPGR